MGEGIVRIPGGHFQSAAERERVAHGKRLALCMYLWNKTEGPV